jgi:beta-glucanase (GH16 family)
VWSVDRLDHHRVERSNDRTGCSTKPFYIVVNLAIGGTLGGDPAPVDFTTKTFSIDRIRVFGSSHLLPDRCPMHTARR